MNPSLPLPLGFRAHVTNVGVKDGTDDFTVVAADQVCAAAGVFTRSSFAGPSVLVSRRHVADGRARAMVVVSKNANVATGPQGQADAEELAAGVAAALGCEASEVLVASTGVIGRQYPMDRIRAGLRAIPSPLPGTDANAVARGIMTTDTVPKTASASAGAASVVGVAKGVGMIEPDMATMIAMVFTDALVGAEELDAMFRRVVDRTFNCVSVDTDTSTSDTAVVLASGAAGAVDGAALERALYDVCASLTRQIASDGEGATKLLEVTVDDKKQKSLTCGGDIFAGPMKAGEKAFLNFSCIPKDVVPEDAAAIEGELEIVGFTGKESKKADTYWKNEDLVPKDRPKGGIKKK